MPRFFFFLPLLFVFWADLGMESRPMWTDPEGLDSESIGWGLLSRPKGTTSLDAHTSKQTDKLTG